jgi:hypothetical protein
MAKSQDIDRLLRGWPFQPGVISARLVKATNGREVLQMRIELGVLQMETVNRPDGERPQGEDTYLDHLVGAAAHNGEQFTLSDEQCAEIDREFLQYYHRRICWLALREFDRAVADADHTLELMDFVAHHSPDGQWAQSHEQYRPFVLFHRAQAAALAQLEKAGPEPAIEEIDHGIDRIRTVLELEPESEPEPESDSEEDEGQWDNAELVDQLLQLKEWLREHYQLGRTLSEQLAEAVASEQYELAAKLRDEIALRTSKR